LKRFKLDIKTIEKLIDTQLPVSIKETDNLFTIKNKVNELEINIANPNYQNTLVLNTPITKIVNDEVNKYAYLTDLTIISKSDRDKIDIFVKEVERDLEKLESIINDSDKYSNKNNELTDDEIEKILNVFMSFIDNTKCSK
jgi:hypothetical protein